MVAPRRAVAPLDNPQDSPFHARASPVS